MMLSTAYPAPDSTETSGRADDQRRDDNVSFDLHPGFSNTSSRDHYTAAALAATPQASALLSRRVETRDSNQDNITPLLLNTASAARGRRRDGGVSNNNNNINGDKSYLNIVNPNPRPRNRPHRAASELVLNVGAMEEVHGVDVSWLHHPNKGHLNHRHTKSSPDVRKDAKDAKAPSTTLSTVPERKPVQKSVSDLTKLPSPPNVTPPTPVEPTSNTTNAFSSNQTPPSSANKPQPKRPSLLQRGSAERLSQDGKSGSKRSSWMNSISSKFSSQGTPERPGPTPTQSLRSQPASSLTPPASGGSPGPQPTEEAEPYTPAKPKESSSSFFSSISRRLSAASQSSTNVPKVDGKGGICERRVLNVDPNRERCLVPEMDPTKLRRVSFCVDVEIAGGPRYRDDDDDDEETRQKKRKEFKMKEKAEGAALKNPEALAQEKDEEGEAKLENKSTPKGHTRDASDATIDENTNPQTEEERDAAARKREKKQRSEAERKERKEKRRKRAEENGQIPVELSLDGDDGAATTAPQSTANGAWPGHGPDTPMQPQPNSARQDRPTTDPARIYRRCCQLRESPILKRITEQLSNPKCILPHEPGVVNCLDLTGSRLQLADVVSLGDWLAVVPVKVLKLEDADLSDEGVRCILAGLLAAKKPEPSKRKSVTPRHREGIPVKPHQERAGVVEKINLKNNPRLTRAGWKHISLFIYMCRSLKAIDLSVNQFPDTLPPSAHVTPIKSPQMAPKGPGQEIDAAEALYKCLSERTGGKRLEELIMSECGLTAPQIRRVVDGAIMCGISRLGLAGNHIDDDGFEHVLHYVRSGVCQATDLGGNDLRDKLTFLADALNNKHNLPCWGLSLADCNLDSQSLRPLFAALQRLPNFRFLDLSHNRDLCRDNGLVSLLRRYVPQMKDLKRIHLADVNMSPKQAIALADVLPDGPRLAHISLLQNPQLTALANAKTEAEQEEAVALYASLMASVRVSNTLICIDMDIPSAENSEIVKALAKQVVAYSLRNMEEFAIAEATGQAPSTENATSALTHPYGGEKSVKEVSVPDVLYHLVGHVDGGSENHDNDPPAPDEDYIVGGTGVVKALQYVLGEKANDSNRNSLPPTPTDGTPTSNTPTGMLTPKQRPASSAGYVEQAKAKKMSKNLLGSARKIRERLQPALLNEANSGDDMAYRRLLFLDQTLQSMIERFEEEYPDCRLAPPSPRKVPSEVSSLSDTSKVLGSSVNTQDTEFTNAASDEEDLFDAEDSGIRPVASRHNSDVSLASRKLSMEEGRLHRIGQHMRREVVDSPRSAEAGADWPDWRHPSWETKEEEKRRLRALGEKIEGISGVELEKIISNEGWSKVLENVGATYDDLRALQEQDPEAWEAFKDAQMKARMNTGMEPSDDGSQIGTTPPAIGGEL